MASSGSATSQEICSKRVPLFQLQISQSTVRFYELELACLSDLYNTVFNQLYNGPLYMRAII
jgi:hypothetical protein